MAALPEQPILLSSSVEVESSFPYMAEGDSEGMMLKAHKII